MTFEQALTRMKFGGTVTRKGWLERNGAKLSIDFSCPQVPQFVSVPDDRKLPKSLLGVIVGWCPSNADMMAEDWEAID